VSLPWRIMSVALGFTLAQGLWADQIVSGAFRVDLEPVWAATPGVEDSGSTYPLDAASAAKDLLHEAATAFSSMVYGWSWEYEPAAQDRGTTEYFALRALGSIEDGDPDLRVTSAEQEGSILRYWIEFRLDPAQERQYSSFRAHGSRVLKGSGSAPLTLGLSSKEEALEAAAKDAVRGVLRDMLPNRPHSAQGEIALETVPRYYVGQGRWNASARFMIRVDSVQSYSAY